MNISHPAAYIVHPSDHPGGWEVGTPGQANIVFQGSQQQCDRFVWRLRLSGHPVLKLSDRVPTLVVRDRIGFDVNVRVS